MKTPYYEKVKERLMRYARVNTQSSRESASRPTTACQFDLARMLERELREIGAADVWLDEQACVLYARIPASPGREDRKPFGLVTHMDTAPDAPGEGVKPWVLENYDGGEIVLNPGKSIVMSPADFPNLKCYIGQDLVLTDGTTLLGGDDKASIAAVMTFAETLLHAAALPHGPISLAFTPDEEVGGLARDLDFERFGAEVAYTLDGDHLGYYIDETFNASEATAQIRGRSVHTGTAKGIMKNAADIAAEFMSMLPAAEKPQYTEGREGFFHVTGCEASCEKARVSLIIRDFDAASFAAREELVRRIGEELNAKYGAETVTVTITEQYRNMREVIDTVPFLVEDLKTAIADCGVKPVSEPFRGGTDGSSLSFRGMPCPNLSAGYENAHGRFEYVPVQSMEKNVEILLRLAAILAA